MGEEHLCSKSSGSGASKIYHVGRITDVEGECAFLHTFPLAAIKSDEITEQVFLFSNCFFVFMLETAIRTCEF